MDCEVNKVVLSMVSEDKPPSRSFLSRITALRTANGLSMDMLAKKFIEHVIIIIIIIITLIIVEAHFSTKVYTAHLMKKRCILMLF